MALFIWPQIPHTLISSADLKCCTPTCTWHPPKNRHPEKYTVSVCLSVQFRFYV